MPPFLAQDTARRLLVELRAELGGDWEILDESSR
jgi:hypothetical protein